MIEQCYGAHVVLSTILIKVYLIILNLYVSLISRIWWPILQMLFSIIDIFWCLARWQAKLESSALRLGLVGNICLSFLFFPVARGSSVLPLLGLTSEASIKYHIWLGHLVMTLFTAHGLCYIIFWAVTDELSQVYT